MRMRHIGRPLWKLQGVQAATLEHDLDKEAAESNSKNVKGRINYTICTYSQDLQIMRPTIIDGIQALTIIMNY